MGQIIAHRDSVAEFLREFKMIVVEGRGLDLIPTPKNRKCMLDLGITKKNCRNEILSLSVEDYCEGPKTDKEQSGQLWVFGKEINGMQVYIKLKIAVVGTQKIAKCLSFHLVGSPLCFPYRSDKGGRTDEGNLP